MITEQQLEQELKKYIKGDESLNEELSSDDLREIRKLIRVEIAEIFFDLFKKRGTWV